MKLQNLVEALDAQVVSGDLIGAFDKFAAENCVTRSGNGHTTQTKAEKLEMLNWFYQNIAATSRIECQGRNIGDNVTESQYVFEFMTKQGQPLVYNEVIRRTWKDGKMVEEEYLIGQTLDVPAKSAAKKPSKKAAAKTTKPAAKAKASETTKATKATKKAEPKADQKPASKPATATPKTGRK